MIDTNVGNPELMIEITNSLLKRYMSEKNIYSGCVNKELLNYQKHDKKQFEDVIRFYYREILQRPLGQNQYVYIGNGSLGAFNAIAWSLQKLMNKNPNDLLKIYQINKPPTYGIYSKVAEYIPNTTFKINNSYNKTENYTNDYYYYLNDEIYHCDASIMISPNNPTGEIINERKGYFQIIDSVYDLPPFTNTYEPINKKITNNEIHIDSISKIGPPSYRLGWAIVEDPQLMSKMWEYKNLYNNGLNTSSLFMTDNLIKSMYKYNIFDTFKTITYDTIQKRRKILKNIFNKYGINEYNKNNIYAPYYFVPISNTKFKQIGIDTRKGSDFFFSDDYSRFNLMIYNNKFNEIVNILNNKLHLLF